MGYGKTNGQAPANPKWMQIPRRIRGNAVAVYTACTAYCAEHLTDGRLPPNLEGVPVYGLSNFQVSGAVTALVTAKLLTQSLGSSLEVNDYLEHNPSRAWVEAKRGKDRERQQRHRSRKDGRHTVTSRVTPNAYAYANELPPTVPHGDGGDDGESKDPLDGELTGAKLANALSTLLVRNGCSQGLSLLTDAQLRKFERWRADLGVRFRREAEAKDFAKREMLAFAAAVQSGQIEIERNAVGAFLQRANTWAQPARGAA